MSVRANVTLECDSKGCHAELVMDATDVQYAEKFSSSGLQLEFYASEWQMDEHGDLHCPQCCDPDERDEAYERAAARARNNDFADTGGKDWT